VPGSCICLKGLGDRFQAACILLSGKREFFLRACDLDSVIVIERNINELTSIPELFEHAFAEPLALEASARMKPGRF
jgi:hypothetical protein